MKHPNLVIDTNILLVSVAKNFRYRWIYEALVNSRYKLLVSTEILLEYEELFIEKYGVEFSSNRFSEILLCESVKLITPFFNWHLISSDPDDDKFVDCAIAGNADYIISNVKHFDILGELEFPNITVLSLHEFEHLFKEQFSS